MSRALIRAIFLAAMAAAASAQPTWTRCSEGLPDIDIMPIARIQNVLYCGTDTGGVYKSTNQGDMWTKMPEHPITSRGSKAWAMATLDTFLFVGLRGVGVIRIGVHESEWTVVTNGLNHRIVQDLMARNGVLYAGTYLGGVYKSTDNGDSWTQFNEGLDDLKILSLASNNNWLFCGTVGINTTMPDTGVAFRRRIDGSGVWELINNGFIRNGAHLEAVTSFEASDTVIYCGTDDVGLFRSTDNGSTWIGVNPANTGDIYSIHIVGNAVYYGTSYAGACASFDNGKTWSTNNVGLRHGNTTLPSLIHDMTSDAEYVYAATDLGVFRQRLQGATTSVQLDQRSSPLSRRRIFDLNGREIDGQSPGFKIIRIEDGKEGKSIMLWFP